MYKTGHCYIMISGAITRSWSHYNLITKFCNACNTTKILSWLWLH